MIKEPNIKVLANTPKKGWATVILPFEKEERVIHVHDRNRSLILEKRFQEQTEITLDLSTKTKGVYSITVMYTKMFGKIFTELIVNF